MYRHYDTANAFGSAEDDAPNSCDAPAEQSWNAAPALSDSLLTTQQQQPSTATPAEPPVQPTTTTTYSCTQPTNSRGVTRDRTPLPRCAAPAEKAAVPTVQGAPHQTHPLELKVVEEEVVEEGAMTGTPTSSTTWCSPVQVLPNRITSKKTCGTAGLSAEDPFLLRSTTAAHDVALGASGSGERRSVTVTQQPYSLNHVNHSDYAREYDVCQAKSSGEVADASRLKRAARLLSHDFEAPGRAAEEMKEWRAAETQRRSLQPVAPAPEVLPSPSSPASSASSSSFATPTPAAAGAAEAVASNSVILVSDDAHTKTTASPLNAGGIGRGPERKEDDYGVVSIGVAGAPAQPTPYPVTSTSSLSDWSSAPRLGLPAPTSPSAAEAEVASLPRRDAEERKREDRWYRLCRGVSLLASASPESIVRLRAVARKYGIPHHLRGVMWLTLTGMALKVDENEYFCAMLLRRNGYVTGDNAAAIAADEVAPLSPSTPPFFISTEVRRAAVPHGDTSAPISPCVGEEDIGYLSDIAVSTDWVAVRAAPRLMPSVPPLPSRFTHPPSAPLRGASVGRNDSSLYSQATSSPLLSEKTPSCDDRPTLCRCGEGDGTVSAASISDAFQQRDDYDADEGLRAFAKHFENGKVHTRPPWFLCSTLLNNCEHPYYVNWLDELDLGSVEEELARAKASQVSVLSEPSSSH